MAVEEAVKALKDSLRSDGEIFDRDRELKELLTLVEVSCNRIGVVLGPNNSGKSTLLKRMRRLWDASPDVRALCPMFHLDLRVSDCSTSELAAEHLRKQMRTWASFLKDFGSTLKTVSVSQVIIKGSKLDAAAFVNLIDKEPHTLLTFMGWFTSLAYENPHKKPVFIINEADRLKSWKASEVNMLMGSFIAMTKQERNAVVILSTSDDSFRTWFMKHADPSQWTAIAVGHFNEANAKTFLSKVTSRYLTALATASASASAAHLPETWDEQKIFDVCGGCPQLLVNCVVDVFERKMDLDEVLENMVDTEMEKVELGFVEGEAWDPVKFEQIMKMIVKDVAVSLGEVCEKAFASNISECWLQVQAMLAANLIHIRYVSHESSYQDLEEILKKTKTKSRDFVMARSPAHYRAMQRFVEGGYDNDGSS